MSSTDTRRDATISETLLCVCVCLFIAVFSARVQLENLRGGDENERDSLSDKLYNRHIVIGCLLRQSAGYELSISLFEGTS